MKYKDVYDQWLNEIYDSEIEKLPSWATGGHTAAELMAENDPVAYRCGFSDWLDSAEFECGSCDRRFQNTDADADEDVLCPVCRGEEFCCDSCGDDFDVDDKQDFEGASYCPGCYSAAHDDDDEEPPK